jgi:hypothetical protein
MSSQASKPWVKRLALGVGAVLLLVLALLFVGPFHFDEGPVWHADVVAVRHALGDLATGSPHVLVIGDPERSAAQASSLRERLGARGMHVRFTGEGRMSAWERRYVATYWRIVGMFYEPPMG